MKNENLSMNVLTCDDLIIEGLKSKMKKFNSDSKKVISINYNKDSISLEELRDNLYEKLDNSGLFNTNFDLYYDYKMLIHMTYHNPLSFANCINVLRNIEILIDAENINIEEEPKRLIK